MDIKGLYNIKITSSKSSLKLNEIMNVTVQLLNFNGSNISGKSILLVVDKGTFVVGNEEVGNTIEEVTGTNGFTVKYKATEVGTITFKVSGSNGVNTKKNNNFKLTCDDWDKYTLNTTNAHNAVYLYVNRYRGNCSLYYEYNQTGNNAFLTGGDNANTSERTIEQALIPNELSKYRPTSRISAVGWRPDVVFSLLSDGNLTYRVEQNKTLPANTYMGVRFVWTYNQD